VGQEILHVLVFYHRVRLPCKQTLRFLFPRLSCKNRKVTIDNDCFVATLVFLGGLRSKDDKTSGSLRCGSREGNMTRGVTAVLEARYCEICWMSKGNAVGERLTERRRAHAPDLLRGNSRYQS
jgi:hypothetical protein